MGWVDINHESSLSSVTSNHCFPRLLIPMYVRPCRLKRFAVCPRAPLVLVRPSLMMTFAMLATCRGTCPSPSPPSRPGDQPLPAPKTSTRPHRPVSQRQDNLYNNLSKPESSRCGQRGQSLALVDPDRRLVGLDCQG